MYYYLPLNAHIGSFSNIAEEEKQFKNKLQSINDFEKKLTFFNNNYRSLSTYSMDGSIYYYPHDESIIIYCGRKDFRNLKNFNAEQEQIFFRLRQKEVERIVKGINRKKTYKEQLAFLFGVKGYPPGCRPTVYQNIPFDGTTDADLDLWSSKPVIDLSPIRREDIIVYNDFVRLEFDKNYRNGEDFNEAYTGFDYKKEKVRFIKTFINSLDQQKLINDLKKEIESYFKYSNKEEAENNESEFIKENNRQLVILGDTAQWFKKMVMGVHIDLDKDQINSDLVLNYTVTLEAFKLYRYLIILETNNYSIKDSNTKEELLIENKGVIRSEQANDFLQSTIEDYLSEHIKAFRSEKEYSKAIQRIKNFFEEKPNEHDNFIFVKNGFKRKIGFAIGEVYRCQTNKSITKEVLEFVKASFTIFKDEDIHSKPITGTNLYKYLTTKT